MKRAAALFVLLIMCVAGFLTAKGIFPFIPVSGDSMEPDLKSGSLVTIKPVNPEDFKVGDIIIYNVPVTMREYYNFPAVVSRRVIEIQTTPALVFHTRGITTGVDPFTIRPEDIRGTAGTQIPFLGLPALFLQSWQGLISAAIAMVFLAALLYYGHEILRASVAFRRRIFVPNKNEEKRGRPALTRKAEASEKKTDITEPAQPKPQKAAKKIAQPFVPAVNKAALPEVELKHVEPVKQIPLQPAKAAGETVKPSFVPIINKEKVDSQSPVQKAEAAEKKTEITEPVQPKPQKVVYKSARPLMPSLNKAAGEAPRPSLADLNKAIPPKNGLRYDVFTGDARKAEKELNEALDRLKGMLDKYKDQV